MTHPTRTLPAARMHRTLPRWVIVAAAVGAIGVGIDLIEGPHAIALPMPAAQLSATAALPLDPMAVASLAHDLALEPGASIAAYDAAADNAASPAAAPPQADGDALEPGASVAAYER